MNKKTTAILLELIPVISAPVYYLLLVSENDSPMIRRGIASTMLLAFLGGVFSLIGRRLAGEDRAVRILGVLDWLATASVIGFYILAIFLFGL